MFPVQKELKELTLQRVKTTIIFIVYTRQSFHYRFRKSYMNKHYRGLKLVEFTLHI